MSELLNLLAATCLWVALLTSLSQALVPLLAHYSDSNSDSQGIGHSTRGTKISPALAPALAQVLARRFAIASSLLCLLAFIGLLLAFARNDFSLAVVAENSHSLLSVPWRLAATWGNHEGSLLLWTSLLTLVGAIFACLTDKRHPTPTTTGVALHGGLCFLFLLFVVVFSNPYTPLHPVPADGAALNPLLQDIGLALHPPVLYLGYVGLSLAWVQTAAALLTRQPVQLWAAETLPWLLLAWGALTAGLGLGSLWAYYELGWGGWWFWDPVENLALMPWLVATAALHGVATSRGFALHAPGGQLLCLLAWLLALLATFVVRSGLLTSVHTFALDPKRGLAAFAILFLVAVFSFALYFYRNFYGAQEIRKNPPATPPPFYRGATLLHLLLMPTLAAIVLLGTFYPFALEVFTGTRVSVGTGYYALTFVPLALFLPLGALFVSAPTPNAPFKAQEVAFKEFSSKEISSKEVSSKEILGAEKLYRFARHTKVRLLWVALGAMGFIYWLRTDTPALALVAMGAAAALAFESLRGLYCILQAMLKPKKPTGHRSFVRTRLAMTAGHFALAGFIFAAAGASAWQTETRAFIAPGERLSFGSPPARHSFVFESVAGVKGSNWVGEQAQVVWLDHGRERRRLTPERRYYPASDVVTTETALAVTFLYDFHVQIGRGEAGVALEQAQRQVVVLYRPLVLWLWLAFALAAGTGIVSGLVLLRSNQGRYQSPTQNPTQNPAQSPPQNSTQSPAQGQDL